MRGTWRTVIALWAGLGLSAPADAQSRPDPSVVTAAEAIQYATQVQEVARVVAARYVRQVSVSELVIASLKGLYKAADKPLPVDLGERITRACASRKRLESFIVESLKWWYRAGNKPIPADLADRVARASASKRDFELLKLIAITRINVGNGESVRNPKAINASLFALAESLDPYCAFTPGRNVGSFRVPSSNFGLGMELVEGTGTCPVVVKKVYPGGPAQKAGLRPGDQITNLNHVPARAGLFNPTTWNQNGPTVVGYSRPGDSQLRQGILKPEATRPETVLGVVRLADNSWDYWLDAQHRIAHIRLSNLELDTPDDLNQVLSRLQSEQMAGLILDLRWCPGGYLKAARSTADLFVGDYNVSYFVFPTPNDLAAQADPFLDNHRENATVWYRDGHLDVWARPPGSGFPLIPMIVLVNGESSGGAELIAAVLQDNRRARIMGQRTRGKASVQEVLELLTDPTLLLSYRIEGTLKISNGLLERPSGKNLNRFPDSRPRDSWGVQPDQGLEYRVSPDLGRQLQTWWQWQDLRPGSSNESLPLDNPATDPQRQAALRALLQNLR